MKMAIPTAVLVLLATSGLGQSKKKPVMSRTSNAGVAAVSSAEKTLLWEISGKDLKKPSYLFGTMHILCAQDARLSDSLKNIIKRSEQIFFEIDMDNMQELMGAMKFLRMNDGQKISDLLSSDEYTRVKNWFDENNSMIPFSMMNRFKPYFVSSLVGEQLMSCDKKNGMEELIMRESKKFGIEIKGLETAEFQAGLFDSIPYDKQARDLVNYIDSIDHYKLITHQMVDVYREQDLQKMDSLLRQSDPGIENYMDLLLYGRNRRWAQFMPLEMRYRSTLFAVGAGHLPGEEGVIELLRKAGYKVKPIRN